MWENLTGLLLLLLAALNVVQSEDKYFADGGTLTLLLNATSSDTKNILWKFNENLLAESAQGDTPLLDYFGRFRVGTTLNTNTADLEIRNMTKADEGVYSVELNGSPRESYKATLIRLIQQPPKVVLRTLTCTKESEICLLTCEADTTGAGPVTYWWRFGEGKLEQKEENTDIIKGKHAGVETITCLVKNPLGEKESEPFKNLLYSPPGSNGGIIALVIFLVAAVVGGGVVLVLWIMKLGPFKKKDTNDTSPEGQGLKESAGGADGGGLTEKADNNAA